MYLNCKVKEYQDVSDHSQCMYTQFVFLLLVRCLSHTYFLIESISQDMFIFNDTTSPKIKGFFCVTYDYVVKEDHVQCYWNLK